MSCIQLETCTVYFKHGAKRGEAGDLVGVAYFGRGGGFSGWEKEKK